MEFIIAYDIFGCEIALGKGYGRAASPESKEMGKKWFEGTMQGLLDRRRVRSHPVKVVGRRGDRGRRGGVSGQKLVVMVE